MPGGEVSREEQLIDADDESDAQAGLCGLHTNAAGRAAAL